MQTSSPDLETHPVRLANLEAVFDSPTTPTLARPVQSVNAVDCDILPPALFTPSGKEPSGPQKEKPIHRTIAYMLLSGKSQKQVAELVQCSETTVSRLVNMTWFRGVMSQIAQVNGSSDVMALLSGAATGAAVVLVEQLNSANEKTRASAANSILDRVLGKAVQRVQNEKVQVPVDPRDELAAINDEINLLLESSSKLNQL